MLLSYFFNKIFIEDQSIEICKNSEFRKFIKALDAILLKIKHSQVLPDIFINCILATDLWTIISNQEQFFNVNESWRKNIDLSPI